MKIKINNLKQFSNKNKVPEDFKVLRTWESTAFEIACGLLLALTWVFVGLGIWRHGEQVNTTELLMMAGMSTFIVLVMLILAYRPQSYNMPTKPTFRQFKLTVRFVRTMAFLLSVTFFIVTLGMGGWVHSDILQIIPTILIGVAVVVYLVMYFVVK